MPDEMLETVRREAERTDYSRMLLGEAKETVRKRHWELQESEADLKEALAKAGLFQFLTIRMPALTRFLNESYELGLFD